MVHAAADFSSIEPSAQLEKGYVQVYTGNGKGKTTAAIGLAVRAIGAGLRIYIAQFMKTVGSSELQCLEQLTNHISIDVFHFQDKKDTTKSKSHSASNGWQTRIRKTLLLQQYDIVILEEANMAMACGLITPQDILSLIAAKPRNIEMVITGRYAHPEIIEKADLVTEMQEVKHYFRKGVNARVGIEM